MVVSIYTNACLLGFTPLMNTFFFVGIVIQTRLETPVMRAAGDKTRTNRVENVFFGRKTIAAGFSTSFSAIDMVQTGSSASFSASMVVRTGFLTS